MRSCLPILFAALGTIVALPADTWAQGQLGDMKSLTDAYRQGEARRKELDTGVSPVAKDKQVAEAAAQYYLHRDHAQDGADRSRET